ncbi:unnamed protein product [Fraxinus pennsylvanica]|uniref:Uncharacterized protein n=1 Tax=Fraxinus pennsylvanica TaxID=56036 RepID=A0AAD1ZP69_9LAMI|nr:unnamed protein product [Fraxinus pennsylvanica]
MHNLVVKKQEKPHILSGLPPAIENVVVGCFEHDNRSRPLMAYILHAFKRDLLISCANTSDIPFEQYAASDSVQMTSSQNAVYQDRGWMGLGSRMIREKPSGSGYTEWFLAKDHLQTPIRVHVSTFKLVTFRLAAGDWVRLKKGDKKHSPVGVLHSITHDGSVAVAFIGLETLWKGNYSEFQMAKPYFYQDRGWMGLGSRMIREKPSGSGYTEWFLTKDHLQLVTFGLAAGDWVRLKKEDKKHSPVGVLHSITHDGSVAVAFIGLETLWKGNYSKFQMAKPYRIGQFIRLKSNVFSP